MTAPDLTPTALVVCSTQGKCLPVMAASMQEYLPLEIDLYLSGGDADLFEGRKTIHFPNTGKNFGDSYNAAIDRAFQDGHDYIWIANDDIVFHPNTWTHFQEDLRFLAGQSLGGKIGIVGARSDFVLWPQNIRNGGPQPHRKGLRWALEEQLLRVPVIAPILAWVSRDAWQTAQFPPTNWYSDNIWCWDLQRCGFIHFASRAYVHHAGSQTIGQEASGLHQEAWSWIEKNRPDFAEMHSKQIAR